MKFFGVFLGCLLWSSSWANDASIVIEDSFARAAIQQQRNSAAFMLISNHSQHDMSVIGAQSDVAKVVELHTHKNDNGIMRMRKISQIELPAGQQVQLKHGGMHIMLLGLKKDLVADETIDLTLLFSDKSEQTITVPVKHMHHQKMKHKKPMHSAH